MYTIHKLKIMHKKLLELNERYYWFTLVQKSINSKKAWSRTNPTLFKYASANT